MITVVISCEHGGNQIPSEYTKLFIDAKADLDSHRGWDIGALVLAEQFAQTSSAFHYTEISRLLVELNRSTHHQQLFSKYTKHLSKFEKENILENYYHPYRNAILNTIQSAVSNNSKVIHVSVHSFTSILNGEIRSADIGLLYDPSRKQEKIFCALWRKQILSVTNQFRVRMNYPYLGKADGLVTILRKQFAENEYLGIELECNQVTLATAQDTIQSVLIRSFKELLTEFSTLPPRGKG